MTITHKYWQLVKALAIVRNCGHDRAQKDIDRDSATVVSGHHGGKVASITLPDNEAEKIVAILAENKSRKRRCLCGGHGVTQDAEHKWVCARCKRLEDRQWQRRTHLVTEFGKYADWAISGMVSSGGMVQRNGI